MTKQIPALPARAHSEEGNKKTDSTEPANSSAKLFDLRFIIGGLFAVYGVVLTAYSLTTAAGENLAKTDGMRINLLTGVGMLLVGAFFFLWGYVRPVRPDIGEDEAEHSSTAAGAFE